MAHFAELNESNIVTQVVVVHNNELLDNGAENEAKGVAFLESLYGHGRWKQTSYHGNIRKNYAGIGFAYDADRDAFIAPQPFASWSLDESTCTWVPPVPYPTDGGIYRWDEASGAWLNVQ
jgi:hypothetical protein